MTKAMVAVVIVLGLAAAGAQEAPRRTHLVIVVDGLRPDYVTPEVMPRLTALGQRGIVFNAHHSVFPTVTRVNASSFVTGVYPEAHGLMGNTIYVPRANATGTSIPESARTWKMSSVPREGCSRRQLSASCFVPRASPCSS